MGWFDGAGKQNSTAKKANVFFKSFESWCSKAKSFYESSKTYDSEMDYYNTVQDYIDYLNTERSQWLTTETLKPSGANPKEKKAMQSEYEAELEKANSVLSNELKDIALKMTVEKQKLLEQEKKQKIEAAIDDVNDRVARQLKVAPPSPVANIYPEPLFYLDGRGSNLYVYPEFIVIDRTRAGIVNLANRTYKIIPIKYITGIQFKSDGLSTGYLEFSTYAHENTTIHGIERINDENNINFQGVFAKVAQAIVEFLLPKII